MPEAPSPEMVERAEKIMTAHANILSGATWAHRCEDWALALTAAHAEGRAKGLEEAAKTCREESDHWNPYGRVVENETVQTRQQARAQMAMELGARFRRAAEEARRG